MDIECEFPAYMKIETIRIVSTANDYVMTQDMSITFDIIIGPDCSSDEVSVFQPLEDLTYNIIPTPTLKFMTPLFKTSQPGMCTVKCKLIETGVTPEGYSSPAIADFLTNLGQITISTSDTSLHGDQIELTVECTDPVSLTAKKSASTTATVTFWNICYDA